jgi:hypothetical protein
MMSTRRARSDHASRPPTWRRAKVSSSAHDDDVSVFRKQHKLHVRRFIHCFIVVSTLYGTLGVGYSVGSRNSEPFVV